MKELFVLKGKTIIFFKGENSSRKYLTDSRIEYTFDTFTIHDKLYKEQGDIKVNEEVSSLCETIKDPELR